jgi:hypothetical protein
MTAANAMDRALWGARSLGIARVRELMTRVAPDDLTTIEVLTLVAVLEAADTRVNTPDAPVIKLPRAEGGRR